VVGLGLGIDYSLLMVTRFREELATGARHADAVGRTVATAGRTVLLSGLALVVAATSLLVVRIPVAREAVAATVIVAFVAMASALTLLPALLAMSGSWLDRGALAWHTRPEVARQNTRWARWAGHLMRHPLPYAIGVSVLLLVAAAPALGLRLGLDIPRTVLADTSTGKGLAVLEQDSFAGATGTVTVLIQRPPGTSPPDTALLTSALRADPDILAVVAAGTNRDSTLLLALPRDRPDAPETVTLVTRIRDQIVPEAIPPRYSVLTGGLSAAAVDLRQEAAAKLWWVIGLALAAAFLFLVLILRSILLPLKAIVMNLLATGASYGLLVLVFQNGLGERLLGFTSTGTIQAYWPVVMFIILFALSLDYEIFLVRRIQEEFHVHGDNRRAVAVGLQATAHSISLAAATLIVLFASLLAVTALEIKQVGFALAVAVALDATLIRLVLVPALMQLFGHRNWWLPDRLSRLLPAPMEQPKGHAPGSEERASTGNDPRQPKKSPSSPSKPISGKATTTAGSWNGPPAKASAPPTGSE
jgi:RND superfamily putative drug exporter